MSTLADATLSMVAELQWTTPPTEEGGLPVVHAIQMLTLEWTEPESGRLFTFQIPNPAPTAIEQGAAVTFAFTITEESSQ